MKQSIPASKLYRRVGLFLIYFIVASISFHGFYSKWRFRETGVPGGAGLIDEQRFGLAEILDGTATRPYVYRQLIPYFANRLDRVTPQGAKDWIRQAARHETLPAEFKFDSAMAGDPKYSFRYFVVYTLTFLFALLSVYGMYLACGAIELTPVARVFAPVLMMLLIPYLMTGGGYYYDYPELAFLSLAVWMALRFNWWWMLPLVAVATWNKESFLLIVLTLYPLLRSRSSRMNALLGTGLLALASAAVYWALRLRYAQNAGVTVLYKLKDQVKYFIRPYHYFGWETTYGIVMFKSFSLLGLALIAWTVWRGWRLLPLAIRRYGQVAAAINLPLFLLFCQPGEMRDLSMLYVFFLLLMAAVLSAEIEAVTGNRLPQPGQFHRN